MEVTEQGEEPAPVPPPEQSVDNRNSQAIAAHNATTELALNLVDSVLETSATEASRIQSMQSNECLFNL